MNLNSLKQRNSILGKELQDLKEDLKVVFDNNHEAGVIDRGYYAEFNRILERHRSFGIIERWMLSEDEYVIGESLVKIPIVDVIKDSQNYRIFVID